MGQYRDLLKAATALKKSKKFDDACKKLEEAYAHRHGEYWTIAERLRLPAYLQIAGRSSEALSEYYKLLDEFKYINQPTQALSNSCGDSGWESFNINFNFNAGNLSVIYEAMSVFFAKQSDYKNQLISHIFSYVLMVTSKIFLIQNMHAMADEYLEMMLMVTQGDTELMGKHLKFEAERNKTQPPHAYTKMGNPVRDVSYPHLKEFIEQRVRDDFIVNDLKAIPAGRLLSEACMQELCYAIVYSIDKEDLSKKDWMDKIHNIIHNGML